MAKEKLKTVKMNQKNNKEIEVNANKSNQSFEDITVEKSSEIKDDNDKNKEIEDTNNVNKESVSKENNVNNEPSIEEKFDVLNDKYIRLVAEYDNYRKRTLKERMELIKNAGEDILINFLPTMDNIDRALKSTEQAKDMEAVKQGIALIHKNLSDFLKERGITEINAIGETFNTDLHEALTKIPVNDDAQKGKVVDIIEKGYMLKDKVLRFAKVVVGE
jgi:molecular chaperone GrpE